MAGPYYVDVGLGTSNPVWQVSTAYSTGDIVTPVLDGGADNKYVYEVTDDGGTSHSSTEPSWPTTPGNTVVDNNITWTCRLPDSWDEALNSLQGAADLAAAGEIVYCRGTQTLSGAAIDFDTNAGTNAAGWIKFIGCNASGNVDGTRFIVDANGGSHDCIKFTATSKMVWFENIECKNTGGTGNGFNASAYDSAGCVFVNCCANGCSSGWSGASFSNGIFYRCVAYANRGFGFYLTSGGRVAFCCARDNTDDGFAVIGATLYNCVSHSNTEEGFSIVQAASMLINCVADRNADDGIEIANYTSLFGAFILASRVTNHSGSGDIGIRGAADGNDEPFITALCYFEDNDTDISDDTLHKNIPLENSATSSNAADTPDTNAGYVNETESTAGTTNLSTNYVSGTDPTLRRTAVTIPFD